MRTASLVLAAAALAALAFALPTVSASTTCTPTGVPVVACSIAGPAVGQACAFAGLSPQVGHGGALACTDVVLPPDPTDLGPSHVCASASLTGVGGATECVLETSRYGSCVTFYLFVFTYTECGI